MSSFRTWSMAAAIIAACGASGQPAADALKAPPIVNFSLPNFTPEGNRAWMVRGSEAWRIGTQEIEVHGLNMTVFRGDSAGSIETIILSPQARVRPAEQVVTGPSEIRVINDEFEASGTDWRYAHAEKKVSIARNVRVTFRAELGNLLQ